MNFSHQAFDAPPQTYQGEEVARTASTPSLPSQKGLRALGHKQAYSPRTHKMNNGTSSRLYSSNLYERT